MLGYMPYNGVGNLWSICCWTPIPISTSENGQSYRNMGIAVHQDLKGHPFLTPAIYWRRTEQHCTLWPWNKIKFILELFIKVLILVSLSTLGEGRGEIVFCFASYVLAYIIFSCMLILRSKLLSKNKCTCLCLSLIDLNQHTEWKWTTIPHKTDIP